MAFAALKRKIAEAVATRAEAEAAEERRLSKREGATRIADTRDRDVQTVYGVVRAVTVRPRTVAACEVELFDGTGALSIVWLGRHEKPDVRLGVRMVATGLVRVVDGGRKVMVDPRYDIVARVH